MTMVQTRYRKDFHDPWAWSLAVKGATIEEIAAAFGIARKTLHQWLKDDNKKSLQESVTDGKQAADAHVEKSLYKRCLGYTVTEAEKLLGYDENGKAHQKQTRIREKHIPPDTMAIMYWLNNRHRKDGTWSQKQEIAVTGIDMVPDIPEDLADAIIALAEAGRNESSPDS
jgi:transposase-like protein